MNIKSFIKEYPIALNYKIIIAVYSMLLSCATILPLKKWYFAIIILSIIIFTLLCLIFKLIKHSQEKLKNKKSSELKIAWWIYTIIFFVLFSLCLITLLANYPGIGGSDSADMAKQAIGYTTFSDKYGYNDLNNHHSLFYVFLFWICCKFVEFTNNVDIAIFIFLLIQITLICFFVCFSISWSLKHTKSKIYLVLLSLFLVFNPIIIAYSCRMFKDVPFTFLVVLLSFLLFDITTKKHVNNKIYIKLTVICLLICLFRNTGIFVCIFSLLYLFVLKAGNRKVFTIIACSLIAAVVMVQGPLTDALNAKHAHFIESVGVPVQQIARSLKDNGQINNNQLDFINELIPTEQMINLYDKTTVDSIKFSKDFNKEFLDNNKIQFLITYITMFPSNIKSYLIAWVWETYGYWSPCRAAPSSGNSAILSDQNTNHIGFELAPWKISNFVPYRIIFNNSGLLIWILFAYLMLKRMIVNKDWRSFFKDISWFAPLFAIFIILMLCSPKTDELRYVLPLYLIIPYLPCFWNSKQIKA